MHGSAQGGCQIIGSTAIRAIRSTTSGSTIAAKKSDSWMPNRVDWLNRIGIDWSSTSETVPFLLVLNTITDTSRSWATLPATQARHPKFALGCCSWRRVHVLQATDHVGRNSHIHLLGIRQTWQTTKDKQLVELCWTRCSYFLGDLISGMVLIWL